MANIIATNADTNIDLNDNDRLYVPQGVTVISSNSDQAVETDAANPNANNHGVAVDGTVIAFSANAITLNHDTNDNGSNTLLVGRTGIVRTLNNSNSALYILGSGSQVHNWGEISGHWSAWYQDFNNGLVENHGVMSGSNVQEGIFFTSSMNYVLVNTGLIIGGGGVQNSASVGKIWNSGEVIATSPNSQALDLDSSFGDLYVNNSGLISSLGTAVHLDTFNDTFINSGHVIGHIKMFAGNDYFDGRGGTVEGDVEGGTGDDTYLIDDRGIELVELSGQGTDTVRSWISYTLPDHIETLILQGEEEINGIGNDQDNIINGNNAANELSGGAGDDTLNGGWGDDILNGDDGNDTLRGHAGADRMVGGLGDDTYFINVAADQLVEYANEGTDHVHSPISFSLRDYSQHLENLTLSGTANTDGTGNGQGNTITGNSGDNVLNGAAAGDVLLGGAGNDTFLDDSGTDQMVGGTGDDTYFVDHAADQLIELAGEGEDSVFSPISFALRDKSQHLENLTLTGSDDIDGTGNGRVNTITGNDGDNVLNGAGAGDILIGGAGDDTFQDDGGADLMTGGTGDDTYFVDNAADSLIEFAGEGTDSVFASLTFALRDKSQHLENLTLTGSGDIDGTGNGQANIITGNSGDNTLNGAGGNDTLNGGAGDDIYNDDAGADRFEISVFDGLQNDEIVGFANTADTIAIELGAFDQSTVNVANLGGNTIITYGDGLSTLLLSGVTLIETEIMFSFS